MNWLLEIGLANAVFASGLAIVAALVGRFVRRPALVHALWLLVLLKLVTPPLFRLEMPLPAQISSAIPDSMIRTTSAPATTDSQVRPPLADSPRVASTDQIVEPVAAAAPSSPSVFATPRSARPVGDQATSDPPAVIVVPPRAPSGAGGPTFSCDGALASTPPGTIPGELTSSPTAAAVGIPSKFAWLWTWQTLAHVIMGIWIAGSVYWFAFQGMRLGRFLRFLKHAEPAPEWLQRQTASLARVMGLRQCPEVKLIPGAISPMLWFSGWRAQLLFPEELLDLISEKERATLLAHELAHYHRGDHWVRLLEMIVGGLYWWLPLLWWARHEIEVAEEICCDAWVVSQFPTTRRCYAEALLQTIDFLSGAEPSLPPAASGIGYVPFLKKRLTMILHADVPRRLSRPGRHAVLATALALLPLQPAFTKPATARLSTLAPEAPLAALSVPLPSNEIQSATDCETLIDRTKTKPVSPEFLPFGHPLATWATAISPNGDDRVSIRNDRVVVLSRASGADAMTFAPEEIAGIAFSPSGAIFASRGSDNIVRLRECGSGRLVGSLVGLTAQVRAIAFSPNGSLLAAGDRSGAVVLWDVASQQAVASHRERSAAVSGLCFSPDGARFAVATGDWRAAAPGLIEIRAIDESSDPVLLPCESPAAAIAFDETGDRLLCGEWNGQVTRWDLHTQKVAERYRVAKDAVAKAEFSPNADSLLTAARIVDAPSAFPLEEMMGLFGQGSVSLTDPLNRQNQLAAINATAARAAVRSPSNLLPSIAPIPVPTAISFEAIQQRNEKPR